MKLIIKAHLFTAIAGWFLIMIVGGSLTLEEGGLVALGSLCLMGVATVITIVDLVSVYLVRKGKTSFLPFLSAGLWGLVFMTYGLGIFMPDQPWQSRAVFLALVAIAVFKVSSIIVLLKGAPTVQSTL